MILDHYKGADLFDELVDAEGKIAEPPGLERAGDGLELQRLPRPRRARARVRRSAPARDPERGRRPDTPDGSARADAGVGGGPGRVLPGILRGTTAATWRLGSLVASAIDAISWLLVIAAAMGASRYPQFGLVVLSQTQTGLFIGK